MGSGRRWHSPLGSKDSDVPEIALSILEFIEHPDLLNDKSLSMAQKICLKSTYGLPLDSGELDIYRRATGRQIYDAREQQEVTIIAGRRSGKTTKIAAAIVCYEAFRDHGLPLGEEGYVMLLAPTLKQAKIAFRAIRRNIQGSPVLSASVVRITKDEIELKNGVIIGCYACTHDGVRGHSIVTAVCDEIGFWSDEETAANPAEEVIAALVPGMATVRNSKLVKISTPYRKEGVLWREFQQRAELDFPVWQLSSQEMNPMISSSILEKEMRRSEEKFRREFLAEFTDSTSGWIVPEILDPCIVRGRTELPYTSDGIFLAVADPAFVRDDFALAILSRRDDGRIIVHRVVRWSGTKAAPLGHEDVLAQVKSILGEYQLNSLTGDQYCFDIIRQHLDKLAIYYKKYNFDARTRPEIFANLRHLLSQRKIELVDNPELLRQLRSLQEHRTDRGQVDIRPAGGAKDDLAVAVALAASELEKQPTGPPPFLVPEAGPRPLRVDRNGLAGGPTLPGLNIEPDIGDAIINGRELTPEQEDRLLFGRLD
jgi:Phage Terminase